MRKIKKTLGEKLREYRENYDLSQAQVAAALNIDRSTYTNYELDKTRPNLEMLVKLARIFNVPKDTFLPEDDSDDTVNLRDVFQPSSMVSSLSKEERGMLALYRSLPREQRQRVYMDMLKAACAEKDGEDS